MIADLDRDGHADLVKSTIYGSITLLNRGDGTFPGYVATGRLGSLIQTWAGRDGISADEVEKKLIATIPVSRLGAPDEIGSVAAFLASPAASYVNGVNMPVDGGRLARQ